MNNEAKILSILESMDGRLSKLEEGQERLEAGQERLGVRQTKLEEGQAKMEARLDSLEKEVKDMRFELNKGVWEDIKRLDKRISRQEEEFAGAFNG